MEILMGSISMAKAIRQKFLLLLNNLEEIIIVILVLVMIIMLSMSVVIRYALPMFSYASHWVEEIAVYSFVWTLYWGASLATRKGSHFRVTVQFFLLPEAFRKYATIPGDIVLFFFCLVIMKFGWLLVQLSWEASLSLQIPMKYVYAIIPISFLSICVRLIQYNFNLIKKPDKDEGSYA